MDDGNSSMLSVIMAGLAILVLYRLLNNLLKAGFFGLGRISILAMVEKAKQDRAVLWHYLEEPMLLKYSTQIFDKLSLLGLLGLLMMKYPNPSFLNLGVLCLYIVVFDLIIPSVTAAFIPEKLVSNLFPFMRGPYLLFAPFTHALIFIARKGRENEDEEAPEDIKAFLMAGAEEGIIEEKEQPLIHNLLNFNDTVVREVMTPRTDMECLEITMSNEEINEVFRRTKYSRLPVYRGDIDRIEGVLRFKDFIEISNEGKSIEKSLTRVMFMPENKNISDLLEEMLTHRTQMVIVIDEYGGTAGLTTLEDLIEEIIGEIHDEHEEPDADEIIELKNGSFLVDGKVLLEDFCEMFSIDVEVSDVDTIGGFIFNHEGRIPKEGSHCEIGGLSVEIARADDRRIYQVKVTPQSNNAPVTAGVET